MQVLSVAKSTHTFSTMVLVFLHFAMRTIDVVVGEETQKALIWPLTKILGEVREQCRQLEQLVQVRGRAQECGEPAFY